MSDRRREIRKKLMAFTPVYDKQRGVVLGYLGNLTLQGALVMGEKALELDSLATLVFELPSELPGVSAKKMTIAARVARCVPDEDNPRDFNIGFEFVEINPEHTMIIQALLERYYLRYNN